MAAASGRTHVTQRERSDSTIEALLAAAREQFATHGYHAASLDAVCGQAHMTKGALYHHFSGKKDLFRAVYEREQRRLARVVARAYTAAETAEPGAWQAVYAGARAFLAEVLAADVQRITLLDAPSALGTDAIREMSTGCLQMMQEGIRRAAEAGDIATRSVPALGHLLYGALCESAMAIAGAEDQEEALAETLGELEGLFDALAVAGRKPLGAGAY
ncbi:TetR/AcrR family transcriptional regulator [Actinacidiphila guanduensis]|uniref:Transcriptional regulator, TetR family n=1 Tax=Actinacidiphila guanduensis TaxID=310781 RepID=A0A1H0HGM8_9ACTN|nr:TetR/AcrR family transcriptional regulator [Actinacidiphila guanduensis]SDO18366.1 transcriptional regulator, TetR family [Actinacidiphila guanduensis]